MSFNPQLYARKSSYVVISDHFKYGESIVIANMVLYVSDYVRISLLELS